MTLHFHWWQGRGYNLGAQGPCKACFPQRGIFSLRLSQLNELDMFRVICQKSRVKAHAFTSQYASIFPGSVVTLDGKCVFIYVHVCLYVHMCPYLYTHVCVLRCVCAFAFTERPLWHSGSPREGLACAPRAEDLPCLLLWLSLSPLSTCTGPPQA